MEISFTFIFGLFFVNKVAFSFVDMYVMNLLTNMFACVCMLYACFVHRCHSIAEEMHRSTSQGLLKKSATFMQARLGPVTGQSVSRLSIMNWSVLLAAVLAITSQPHVNMSLAWKFFTVSEEDNKVPICNTGQSKPWENHHEYVQSNKLN